MRAASQGGTATTTWRAVTLRRSATTRTAPWSRSMRRTGEPRTTRRPSSRATASGMRADPPSKRACCAPPRVLKDALEGPGVVLVAGRGGVGGDEQQRQLPGLGPEDRPGRERDGRQERGRGALVAQPSLERLAVELGRPRRRPGPQGPDLGGERVQGDHRARELRQDRRVRRRAARRPRVGPAQPLIPAQVHVVADVVDVEGADPVAAGEAPDGVLRRPDERGAALGEAAAAQMGRAHAPADALARLGHEDVAPGAPQGAGGGQARQARADDDHVGPRAAPALARGGGDARQRRRGARGERSCDQLAPGERPIAHRPDHPASRRAPGGYASVHGSPRSD